MENPDTWTDDTKAIQAAIDEYQKQIAQGVIGGSLAMLIEDAVVVPLRRRIADLENYVEQLLEGLQSNPTIRSVQPSRFSEYLQRRDQK